MPAFPERNFAARLVKRLGPRSHLIDAATGVTIGPEDLPRLIAAYGASLRSAGLNEGDRVLIGCFLAASSNPVYWGAGPIPFGWIPSSPMVQKSSVRSLDAESRRTGTLYMTAIKPSKRGRIRLITNRPLRTTGVSFAARKFAIHRIERPLPWNVATGSKNFLRTD